MDAPLQRQPASRPPSRGCLYHTAAREARKSISIGVPLVNSLSPGLDFVVQGYVNNVPAKFLIDTGAAATVISSELWEKSKLEGEQLTVPPGKRLVSVQGDPLQLKGSTQIEMSIGGVVFRTEAVVADSLTTDVILGRDFLKEKQCTIKMGKESSTLRFQDHGVTVNLDGADLGVEHVSIILDQGLHVPPCSEIETMGAVPAMTVHGSWIVEADKQCRSAALVARAIVNPKDGAVPIRLLNPRDEAVTIPKGTKVAMMELLPEQTASTPVSSVQERSQGVPEAKQDTLQNLVENASGLNPQEREQLYALLLEYADVFAETPDDFGRTGKIKHEIDTGTSAPTRQHV